MKRAERVLWALVVLGLIGYAALTLWLIWTSIFFPYQLDYGEGDVMWFTVELARGQQIYYPLGAPYIASNYPPVFMALTAPFIFFFNSPYVIARWFAFAATALVTAFIVRFVWSSTGKWRAALIAALLFLGSTFVYHWAPLYRVDIPGIAFTLAGVFCIWRWEALFGNEPPASKSPNARRASFLYLLFALFFFLLALYTKHSLLFAPAAAILALFIKQRRTAILFTAALGIIGGGIFLALEWATHGGWSFGILTANATVWTTRVFVPLMQSFSVTYAVVLGLALWGWWQHVRVRRIGVLELYAPLALASIVLAGREGAWENYFIEAIAVACIFAGVAIANWRSWRWQWALPALLLVQLFLFWNDHDPRIAASLFEKVRDGNQAVAPLIRAASGDVIAEDMALDFLNGKPVVYYSFPYSTLARAGHWDQHWEVSNLRAGVFSLVVLVQGTRQDVDHYGNFTHAFMSALDYGYALQSEDERYQVYAPAPLQHLEPQAQFGDLFKFVGWSLNPEQLKAGTLMDLSVVWQALQKPPARYTAFAHLENARGQIIAQDDHEPMHGDYPTANWTQDEMVRDHFQLHVPQNLPAGDYVIRIGWYNTATQDGLGMPDGSDSLELTTLHVP